ncbi:hypothetical protein [Desulfatibacillum aliphaticivorans]|uniref:hypothetical protein n=1 Tax=Desulfatibacillum aliphaticivorans TaxID=218208 RepID=UPI00040348A0|nr:hypothetical protein [Desulfatibacillum aliphaticivorans]
MQFKKSHKVKECLATMMCAVFMMALCLFVSGCASLSGDSSISSKERQCRKDDQEQIQECAQEIYDVCKAENILPVLLLIANPDYPSIPYGKTTTLMNGLRKQLESGMIEAQKTTDGAEGVLPYVFGNTDIVYYVQPPPGIKPQLPCRTAPRSIGYIHVGESDEDVKLTVVIRNAEGAFDTAACVIEKILKAEKYRNVDKFYAKDGGRKLGDYQFISGYPDSPAADAASLGRIMGVALLCRYNAVNPERPLVLDMIIDESLPENIKSKLPDHIENAINLFGMGTKVSVIPRVETWKIFNELYNGEAVFAPATATHAMLVKRGDIIRSNSELEALGLIVNFHSVERVNGKVILGKRDEFDCLSQIYWVDNKQSKPAINIVSKRFLDDKISLEVESSHEGYVLLEVDYGNEPDYPYPLIRHNDSYIDKFQKKTLTIDWGKAGVKPPSDMFFKVYLLEHRFQVSCLNGDNECVNFITREISNGGLSVLAVSKPINFR